MTDEERGGRGVELIGLRVFLDADGMGKDLVERGVAMRAQKGETSLRIGVLRRGTKEGRPSVAIIAELDDGTAVILQTTLRLFLATADAFRARYGNGEPEAVQ